MSESSTKSIGREIAEISKNQVNVYRQGFKCGTRADNKQVYDGGYEAGHTDGYSSGFAEGETAGIEEGKVRGEADKLREMWDYLQCGGTRSNYEGAFYGMEIAKENFEPLYDIAPEGSVDSMFLYFNMKNGNTMSMADIEGKCGIKFDFSKATGQFSRTFCACGFTHLNVIDLKGATNLDRTFYGGYVTTPDLKIKRIERLILYETNVFVNNPFGYNNAMEYIGFEGVIAQNGLDISSCVILDKESHKKLINTLSEATSGLSVTVSQTAVNKAFEGGSSSAEWRALINSKPNWTIKLA